MGGGEMNTLLLLYLRDYEKEEKCYCVRKKEWSLVLLYWKKGIVNQVSTGG